MTETGTTDDLTVAWMAGYHKRDAEIERLRVEDARWQRINDDLATRANEQAFEIERLRALLREWLEGGDDGADTYETRIREALGE